ncbi:MAG: hypothetical protein ACTSRA_05525 [Promethearchaeota archaeon]
MDHDVIILAQLGATGIDPNKIKEITGWRSLWGPVHMNDLPEYLKYFLPDKCLSPKKTEKMRKIQFDINFRLEMAISFIIPPWLVLGIPHALLFIYFNMAQWILPNLLIMAVHPLFIFIT